MSSVKESLHNTIELLSEEEANQILKLMQQLRKSSDLSSTLRRLAYDPAFEIPSNESGDFRIVEPIPGKGITASRLLVEDRR